MQLCADPLRLNPSVVLARLTCTGFYWLVFRGVNSVQPERGACLWCMLDLSDCHVRRCDRAIAPRLLAARRAPCAYLLRCAVSHPCVRWLRWLYSASWWARVYYPWYSYVTYTCGAFPSALRLSIQSPVKHPEMPLLIFETSFCGSVGTHPNTFSISLILCKCDKYPK